jgi:hypothetical protein
MAIAIATHRSGKALRAAILLCVQNLDGILHGARLLRGCGTRKTSHRKELRMAIWRTGQSP